MSEYSTQLVVLSACLFLCVSCLSLSVCYLRACRSGQVVSVLASVTTDNLTCVSLAQDASEKCAQQESSSRQTGQFCISYPTVEDTTTFEMEL